MMTPALDTQIRHAGPARHAEVVSVLTEAFTGGAVACWLDPDPDSRPVHLAIHFDTVVADTLAAGIVHYAVDHHDTVVGAALWMPHTTMNTPALTPPGKAGDPVTAAVLERLHLLELMLTVRHPVTPHHHLTYLGVHPAAQEQGIGSRLLRLHHRHLDRTGRLAYLEANDPRNHDLYLRHGYTDVGPPILTPGPGTPIWPMWRHPHTGTRYGQQG